MIQERSRYAFVYRLYLGTGKADAELLNSISLNSAKSNEWLRITDRHCSAIVVLERLMWNF